MKKQNWSLANQDYMIAEHEFDDDNDVQLGNNTFYQCHLKIEPDDEEQETLKIEDRQKTARQTMIERKLHEADIRGQTVT